MDTRWETDLETYAMRGAPGIRYGRATRADDADMRAALCENPMGSWVELSFEREPSCFAPCDLPGRSVQMIARSGSGSRDLVGLYGCSFLPLRLNGAPVEACYLGNLRLRGRYRGRVGIVKGGFASIPHLVPEVRDTPVVFTSVASENRTARRLLERGIPGMPAYELLGEMETFAIATARGKNFGLLERATEGDAATLARFYNAARWDAQLSPVLDEAWLRAPDCLGDPMIRNFLVHRSEGRIAACVAVWDQRPYRQIVVRGYRPPLEKLRRWYNAAARLRRRPTLPPPGGRLEQVFLSFLAVTPPRSGRNSKSEKNFFTHVIREALFHARTRGAETAAVGLSPSSPHRTELRRTTNPLVYRTRIYAVALDGYAAPPRITGTVEPEVALL